MYTAQGFLDQTSAIQTYGPLVRRLAHQMVAKLPANVELDDMIQAGMIGLMDALTRYEPAQGTQFETYAMQRIRGAMLDELRGSDWLPRSVRKNQRTIEQAIHRLEQRMRRPPTESEIAKELGMPLTEYQTMLQDARGAQLIYFDELSDDGEDSYLDRHVADRDSDPVDMLREGRFRQALVKAIEALPEREKFVMGMYYEQDMNLKEIAAVLGVTESRVCQLHSQAVARLRGKLKDQ
jgi:RNA polymerase sigma factor for flagellar operon FliA